MKKKRVGIIGTNGIPGRYGGFEQLALHLTSNLKSEFSFTVYTSYTNADPIQKTYNDAKIEVIRFKANGIQSIPYDIASMIHAMFHCDVLFVCGTSGCIFLPFVRLFGKKVVLNIDGREWKRGKWSKPAQWFLKMSEYIGVHFSTRVVSDNLKIQEYVRKVYHKESSLIEYGGDHILIVPLSSETATKLAIEAGKYAFKVCRIEPENNIHLILKAFEKKNSVDLVLVGNWKKSKYGRDLRKKFGKHKHLKLLDSIYEQEVLDELRSNCGLYIHGHSVGGTNPSLVEAMHMSLCVVANDVDYNRETTENKAIYFSNVTELTVILDQFENNMIDIESYQKSMKEIADRRYCWSIITQKYVDVFRF